MLEPLPRCKKVDRAHARVSAHDEKTSLGTPLSERFVRRMELHPQDSKHMDLSLIAYADSHGLL